ncbi:nucleotide exchange factor GrpE [Capnocytophaga canimorsus]|uniref:nucleotide exchange factor GrpE n=1 Tax=Capnocytophaga canimorsus TaxID=28188 RepID=UPI0005897C14|nr:nucleotide exchange factor GrpE [Capnocytophaga canimorsus]CEN49956.1 Protein GrpE [Capnocytophaga canimorsus]
MKQEDINSQEATNEAQTTTQAETTTEKADNESENLSKEDALNEELAKEKDRFLRLFAEFENYKKRTTKERLELFKTAGQDILSAMLPIIDDFDRALIQISKSEDKEMLKGVELIHSKFLNTLKSKGLEQVEAKAEDVFDSEIHEAVTQIPAPTENLKGKIIDVVEKGYKLGDKVIRYPKVVVGQ